MKRLLLSLLVLTSVCLAGRAQARATYNNYHAGNRYDFDINSEQLAKSPSWSDDQECPPLAARAALKIAQAQMKKLFDDADKWTSRGFQLSRIGERWVYLVEFNEPVPANVSEHFSSPFRVPVLMNGETIEPKVSPWTPDTK